MPELRQLSPQLQEAAQRTLHEDPARREQDIQHLRDWLLKQPHLVARTDDQFLLTFLRGTKFSLERAKEKIDSYYTIRSAVPEFFRGRDPMLPEIQDILNEGLFLPLGCDVCGRPVLLGRVIAYPVDRLKEVDKAKVMSMLEDILLLENDEVLIHGQATLWDLKRFEASIAVQLTPTFLKKMLICMQDAYAVRLQAMHFVRAPSVADAVLKLFRSFLNEKLKSRFMVHKDMDSVFKAIPGSILPQEYGGDAGSISDIAGFWKAKVESYRDYFLEDEKYFADESKRPGKPKTQEDLFGIEGSFRKLEVD